MRIMQLSGRADAHIIDLRFLGLIAETFEAKFDFFRRILRKRTDHAMRKAVYTFIFGGYDDLKSPAIFTPGWDYICFTDDPTLRSDIWDVRLSPRGSADCELDHKKYAIKHMILFD